MMLHDNRRSDRVHIKIPIQVFGKDGASEHFQQEGRTLTVSRHGAAVILSRELATGATVTIRSLATQRAAEARVVGRIGGQAGGYVYGMAFLDPSVNLWDIYFPSKKESDQAAGRILLECRGCRSREVALINELEMEVFEANGSVSRRCSSCGQTGSWTAVGLEPTSVPKPGSGHPREKHVQPTPRRGSKERRKYARLNVSLTACIRHPGFGEEVVTTENISRGGVCFKSQKVYLEGSRIEVAIPYSQQGANIFIPARIIWARELPEEQSRAYGLMYLKAQTSPAAG